MFISNLQFQQKKYTQQSLIFQYGNELKNLH